MAKSAIEFSDHANFLSNLPFDYVEEVLRDRVVLDFGCGYGGRSVWYAQYAKKVIGVEINESQVEASRAFALCKGICNTEFMVCDQSGILCPDDYFDLVISFDVIEHVEHPDKTIQEIYRVLSPGGRAILIFTPYLGAFSHHLNYITLLPGLHWFFRPRDIIAAVNQLLRYDPQFRNLNVAVQPQPKLSFNGKRWTLPSLNGILKREFLVIIKDTGFETEYVRSTPLLEKYRVLGSFGVIVNKLLNYMPGFEELLSHNLVSILKK